MVAFALSAVVVLPGCSRVEPDAAWDSAPGSDGVDSAEQADSAVDTAGAQARSVWLEVPYGGSDKVAVRVDVPGTGHERFAEGAPVVVEFSGGWAPGDISGSLTPLGGTMSLADGAVSEQDAHGFARIAFLFPGGIDQGSGVSSSGAYDYRGKASSMAGAAVLQFAAGRIADAEGRTLSERFPNVDTARVVVAAFSNGGNAAIGALTASPDVPAPVGLLSWESPIGDQFAAVEINDNPMVALGACTIETCPLTDVDVFLRYDPSARGKMTLGDQAVDTVGVFYADNDASGTATTADTRFSPIAAMGSDGAPVGHFSTELRAAVDAYAATVFGGATPPEWLAPLRETAAFWSERDGSARIASAHEVAPACRVMVLQSAQDHIQTAPDYPHARVHLGRWKDAGHAWFRFNPDAA